MKRYWFGLALLTLILVDCGGWGGYVHKSRRFPFRFTFPQKWEVMDRSDDRRDFLVANLPNDMLSEIQVITEPVSPDVEPQEIYLRFLDGGDDASNYLDFEVLEQGTVNAKNGEGRFIKVAFKKSGEKMRGVKAKFLGFKFTLEAKGFVPEDKWNLYEAEFTKMMAMIEFRK